MPDWAGVILGQTPHCTVQNASQMPGVWRWTVLEFTGILTTLNVTTLPFSMPQLNRCQIGHLYQARFLIFCLQRLCAMIFIASSVPIEILDAIVFVISFHPFSGFSTAKLLIT